MSASREKKARQERSASGYVDPKATRAAEEKAKNRRSNLLYALLGVVFVAVAVIAVINNTHVLERGAKAYTVNGETFTAADVSYYYRNNYNSFVSQNQDMISYYFDTQKDLREQEYPNGGTWFDYFADSALNTINSVSAIAKQAKAEGFTADEEETAALENNYSYIDLYAAAQGYTREQYLQAYYGPLMTTEVFERNVRLSALAEAYSTAYEDSLVYSDADIQAAYDADPTAYQSADIEFVTFAYTAESDATDEQKEELLAECKATADTALERCNAGESLEALAEELDGTYYDMPHASKGSSEMLTWAFDDARQSGDCTVIPYSTNGYYVVLFHGRTRDDYHPVSVRHILVDDEELANSILEQYRAGEQTEEAFGLLAAQYSSDGNASSGGLYENFPLGQMVEPFESWAYDSARKAGDTDIVQTDYGYHVMYFVGVSDTEYWKIDAEYDLHAADYNEWFSAITDGVEGEKLDGMKYVG